MSRANHYAVIKGLLQVIGFDAATKDALVTVSGAFGQIATASGASTDQGANATIGHTTGKWYCEFLCGPAWSGGDTGIGFLKSGASFPNYGGAGSLGLDIFPSTGNVWHGTNYGSAGIGAPAANSVLGCAVDLPNNLGWFTLNGSAWSFTGDPAAGTNGRAGGWTVGDLVKPAVCFNGASLTCTLRTRRSTLLYAVPTGFLPWQAD